MEKLEKLHKFLNFWFSPWGAAKGERWEWLTRNKPFEHHVAMKIVDDIWLGIDDLNWEALGD